MTLIGIILFILFCVGLFNVFAGCFGPYFREMKDEWRKTSRRK